MGYWFVFIVFAITFGYTQNNFIAILFALITFTFVSQFKDDKKKKEKLNVMSPQYLAQYEKIQQL